MFKSLRPQSSLSESEVSSGLNMLLLDGVFASAMTILTTGAFLVSFALHLGASHFVIGLISAIQPISQVLQIPTVYLVERTRHRKALTVITAGASRLLYVVVALMPWAFPVQYRISILLGALLLHYCLGAMAGCAFSGWIRDVIPESRMATFFARRMAWSTGVGATLSIAGGAAIDYCSRHYEPTLAYSYLFGAAITAGMTGLFFLARVGEPFMPISHNEGLLNLLSQPFRSKHYRKLLAFIAVWNLTVFFVTPFFTVYLISRLHLSMLYVVGFTVLGQVVNVAFFGLWARLSDMLSNKSVIAVCVPMYFMTFLLWPLTDAPCVKFLMLPILFVIYTTQGIAFSGVTLCAMNLTLRWAPRGKATSYVAVNALVMGLFAALAPILAGCAADYFDGQELTLTMQWLEKAQVAPVLTVSALDLRGLDFVFTIGFLLGILAYYRVLALDEEGAVEQAVVRAELVTEIRRMVRQLSSIASAPLAYTPFSGRRFQPPVSEEPGEPPEN